MSENTAPHDAPLLSRRHEIRLCPACRVAISPYKCFCYDCTTKMPQHTALNVQRYYSWSRAKGHNDNRIRQQWQRYEREAVALIKSAQEAIHGQ